MAESTDHIREHAFKGASIIAQHTGNQQPAHMSGASKNR
jgi:hypothetical protein